jgi:hypothetical protein
MSWCLQWNLAFLGAFFLLDVNAAKPPNEAIFFSIMIALAAIGILISILSFIGIRAAHDQTRFLIREIEKRLGVSDHRWDDEFIRPYGDPTTAHPRARWLSALLPFALMLFWLGAIYYAFPHVFALRH